MKKEAEILLRLALAFVFIYAAASSILNPSSWIGFLPMGLGKTWPLMNWLIVFSAFEVLLSLWILSGWKLFWSSLTAAIVLFAIIITNLMAFDIVFRDLGLGVSAMALAVLSKK
ncbi:MAG: hypothetical protein KGJ01_02525 [Patescibacteria group bacterium]|nr:hypothetical protein [Patescibacteria group bacterium]